MKEFLMKNKVIFLLVFLFFLFLGWNLLITDIYADEVWNYGFSYAIFHGEIPYKDFNMVITPLYPFLMSIFSSNLLLFHIAHAILLTGFSYVLYRLLGEKMWIPLLLLFIPYPATYPSYNIGILFFFVLLLLLEENQKNDYLIGIIVGLSILTKQSIGACLALACLLPNFSFAKMKKRFLGIMIPCIIFLIYLIMSNSFFECFNYCFLGLFDFSGNRPSFNIYYVLGILYVIGNLYFIYKNKKDSIFYYSLAMFSMMIPLFEIYHFVLTCFCLVVVYLMRRKKFQIPHPRLVFLVIFLGVSIIHLQRVSTGIIYPNDISPFKYRLLSKEAIHYLHTMNNYLEKIEGEVVILSNNAYFLRIMRNEKITSLDLINYGNHGYQGSSKLIEEIKKKKGCTFLINQKDLSSLRQTDKSGLQYVIENGIYQDTIGEFKVYILE